MILSDFQEKRLAQLLIAFQNFITTLVLIAARVFAFGDQTEFFPSSQQFLASRVFGLFEFAIVGVQAERTSVVINNIDFRFFWVISAHGTVRRRGAFSEPRIRCLGCRLDRLRPCLRGLSHSSASWPSAAHTATP